MDFALAQGDFVILGAMLLLSAVVVVLALRLMMTVGGSKGSNELSALDAETTPLSPSAVRTASPIMAVSFTELMHGGDSFALGLQQSAMEKLNSSLSQVSGNGAAIAVEGVRFIRSKNIIEWTLTPETRELMKGGVVYWETHKATGKLLPTVKQGGKWFEQLKGEPLSLTKRIATGLPTLIVSTAHIVSGMDVVRRLEGVRQRLDLLVELRRIDQLAEFESIYAACRELLSLPLEEDSRWELWRQGQRLYRLRATIRRELEKRLLDIENPQNEFFLRRWFTRRKTKDRRVVREFASGQAELQLIEQTLLVHLAIADAAGFDEAYLTQTLPNEIEALDELKRLVETKSVYVSEKYATKGLTTKPFVEAMDDIVLRYSSLLPPDLSLDDVERRLIETEDEPALLN